MAQTIQVRASLFDQVSPAIREIERTSQRGFGNVSTAIKGAVAAAGGLFIFAKVSQALGGLTRGFLGTNIAMEQTGVAFEVMLGSAEKANKLLQDVKKTAEATPFQFPELTDSTRKLLAFGSSADTVVEELRRIGDVSAGVQAPIADIAELYGKARVQGTLFAEDINQLTGRGIPIIQEFARQLGVSDGEVKKLASQGQITFPMLEQAFRSLTAEGGRYNGMMGKQSQTLGGLISTMRDKFVGVLLDVGEGGLMGKLRDVTKQATEWMDKNAAKIREVARELGANLANAIQWTIDNFDNIILAGKTFLAVFAASKLTAIAAGIRGIGVALAAASAANPILLALSLTTGAAVIAYDQAKKSAEAFNNEAQNIEAAEKVLRQYNGTLGETVAKMNEATKNKSPFNIPEHMLPESAKKKDPAAVGEDKAASEASAALAAAKAKAAAERQIKAIREIHEEEDLLGILDAPWLAHEETLKTQRGRFKEAQKQMAADRLNAQQILLEAQADSAEKQIALLELQIERERTLGEGNSQTVAALESTKQARITAIQEEWGTRRKQEASQTAQAIAGAQVQAIGALGTIMSAVFGQEDRLARVSKVVISTIQQIVQLQQQLATMQAGSALASLTGLGGGLGIATTLAQLFFHDGGPVGPLRRFHSGGAIARDERPAILQTGEYVLSRADVARMGGMGGVDRARGGGGSPFVFNIHLSGRATQADAELVSSETIRQWERINRSMSFAGRS